jgi:dolichol-phosphate mannosyltransferase
MKAVPLHISIPVYNESDNILAVLEEIESKVSTPHLVNIIYDFDEDNTIPAVNKFIKEHKIQNVNVIKNHYGKGVLNAIKTGFDIVQDGTVLVVMADSSDDLSVVDRMYERIDQGCDIVCGSRYMKGGRQIGGPIVKGFLSRTAGISLHWMTGLPTHDPTNSFKMYRKPILNDIKFESSGGFEIGMEIVVKSFLKGYKISEIPSTWRDRTAGTSRFKLRKWLPKYIKWYLFAISARLKNNLRT